MTDPGAPLSDTVIDVRDMDGFLLNVEKLLASELWAIATGEEFKAAVGLWCRAWKQIPAGSLPNDERVLASFAGATPARWAKIRGVALRGFVLCSDGRLYHRVLCEDAKRAYAAKLARRDQTKAATEARKRRNDQRNDQRNDDGDDQRNVARNEVPGKGRGGGREETGTPESSDVSPENHAHATPPRTAFSTDSQAPTWGDRHRGQVEALLAAWSEDGAKIIDVLRFFRVRFDLKGTPLEDEWRKWTRGQTPVEVGLVFIHAPEGAIDLPSHYRDARKAFETTEHPA